MVELAYAGIWSKNIDKRLKTKPRVWGGGNTPNDTTADDNTKLAPSANHLPA